MDTSPRRVVGEAGTHERSAAIFAPVMVVMCGHPESVAHAESAGAKVTSQYEVEYRDGVDHVRSIVPSALVARLPDAVSLVDVGSIVPPSWCGLRTDDSV
jgi:hypothetical protein